MARRTFAQCSIEQQDLADKEAALLCQLDCLIADVQWAAALGTDEEFAKANDAWAKAEQELAAVVKQQDELDEDFEFYFAAFDEVA